MKIAESEQTSKTVSDSVGQTLQEKKITVLKSPFDESTAMDENGKYLLANIQARTMRCCPSWSPSRRM